MKGYIYKITSPTNKIYIGQTTDLKKRIMFYKKNHCTPQKILCGSIKKYGWEKHNIEVIEESDNKESLNKLEIMFIDSYKSNKLRYPESNGMNLSDGGEGNIGPKSETWKNKMKEKWSSSEYREKMEKIHQSPEWKEMCRNRRLGKKNSEETIEKLKNVWLNDEYRNSMSQKLKKPKTKRTETHNINLSKSLKGRKLSDEHKNKLKEKKQKQILQMDLNNNIIKEWDSIISAEKELKIYNVGLVCNGKQKTAGGYKWKYKN